MEYGVHLPHLGRAVSRDSLLNFAREIERAGAHSGWVSDHICWPSDISSKYPYTDDGAFAPPPDMGWLDPIGTLTFVAAATETLRLGTTVLIVPYRQPVMTAKQIATLDVLSNGRVILGAGVGWMREEAEILGMPWDQRGKRTDEQIAMWRVLFSESSPSFDGAFYQLPEVGFEPKPVQSPLPIWIGGASPAAFRRVAQWGDAFHAAFTPLAQLKQDWDGVRAACEAIGRDPVELRFSLRLYLDPAGAMEPAKSLAGTMDAMLERVDELAAAGVDHLVLDPVARGGIDGRLEAVVAFLEQAAP